MQSSLLFLDFDGVVCDSAEECYESSLRAYRSLGLSVPGERDERKSAFIAGRPFIRNGEDYIVLQDIVHRGQRPDSQIEFDAHVQAAGAARLAEYRNAFYTARQDFLDSERALWLSLNPLYPHLRGLLPAVAADERAFIVSTKKPPFIAEILAHHGMVWPLERIIFPDLRSKRELILERLAPGARALFIDDQLDHLLQAASSPLIETFLAGWGYVKREWLSQQQVPVLDGKSAEALIRERFLRNRALPPPGGRGSRRR